MCWFFYESYFCRSHEGAKDSGNVSNPFNFPLVNTNTVSDDALKTQNASPKPFEKANPGFNKTFDTEETPKMAVVNPFAGFQGLIVPHVKGNTFITSTVVKNDTKDVYASSADVPFSESVEIDGNEYKRKMRKLNSSFFKWTSRQIQEHPQSQWKDGIQVGK
jgi:hypothetical protein